MTGVRKFNTDITRLHSPFYKEINVRQCLNARAVLRENAKYMFVMEDNKLEASKLRRAYTAGPGKVRGTRPMHLSTLTLDHDSKPATATYSRYFGSKKDIKFIGRPRGYPSQFISQIKLEHDKSSVGSSGDTTSKSTFRYRPALNRRPSREFNKIHMRSGVDGAGVVFEVLEPGMYVSTYKDYYT